LAKAAFNRKKLFSPANWISIAGLNYCSATFETYHSMALKMEYFKK
jgi:hypothetical protein